MPSKNWRPAANICTHSSTSKVFNCDNQVVNDDLTIIWCDTSINNNEQDDQHTLRQLRDVSKQVSIFTDEHGCLEHIDRIEEKNKIILIISGSLGENFVPKIFDRKQIYLIYIFCGRKIKHELWAKKYKKIKGVFDNITELRKDLEDAKKNLKIEQMFQTLVDLSPKIFPWTSKFQETSNLNNSKYDDDHQSKDYLKKPVISTNVSFSKGVSPVNIGEIEINNNVNCSETVAPYMPYKQQMEFADTGKKNID
jgi:hypothetical protein